VKSFITKTFIKSGMTSRLRLGCGGCPPEKAEQRMWGVSVPPESQPMKPKAGRSSAISVAKVTKVVEGQNGSQYRSTKNLKIYTNFSI